MKKIQIGGTQIGHALHNADILLVDDRLEPIMLIRVGYF